MAILSQFLLRLAFGLAVGMAITSAQKVSSGFYRNHLYVTLGLSTLAALVLAKLDAGAMWCAAAAAVLSFIGAACWLYESSRAGKVALWLVVASAYAAAVLSQHASRTGSNLAHEIAIASSGLVLGLVFAAMLLGHWYLNAPGMELAPLRRLILMAAVAIAAQMLVVGAGLVADVSNRPDVTLGWILFVVLRWSFGLLGVLGLLWMAWQTLKIPNTQSATGILYVAVIGVFIGELTGLLLSAESAFPL
jgi:hypothetical protein